MIDGTLMGVLTAEVELPEDEENGKEFDRNAEEIFKMKVLEDETFKQFVVFLISRDSATTETTADEAARKFWDERFKVVIKI